MDKMNYEKGLISFTSEHQLAGGKTEIFRPKLIGYAVVLTVMVGLLALEIATRIPLEVDIIRDRGALYRETNDGLIENVYTLKILNKSQLKTLYHVSIEGLPGHRYSGEDLVTVEGGEAFSLPISVAIDESSLEESITSIKIHVTGRDTKGESVEVEEPTKFIFQ
jgi:polyferredoxin